MLPRLHADSDFPDAPQERLQRHADFRPGLSVEQVHAERVEGLDVSFKVFAGEVGVAFHDVDHDGAPGFNVAGLRFVEEDERTNDVGAETAGNGQHLMSSEGRG